MQEVYNRVVKWNAARYEQEYSAELTHQLLCEEYSEWVNAPDQVNDVKELADIVYVALGALWKLNRSDESAQENSAKFIEHFLQQSELMPGFLIGSFLDQNAVSEGDQVQLMHNIISCAMTQMQVMRLKPEQCVQVLLAVCDSNDSKSIKKTPSNEKANNKDKGSYYRPAEPAIRKIMEAAQCLSKTH